VLLEYNNLVTPLVKAPLLALSGLPCVLPVLNLANLRGVLSACEKHKASSNQIPVVVIATILLISLVSVLSMYLLATSVATPNTFVPVASLCETTSIVVVSFIIT